MRRSMWICALAIGLSIITLAGSGTAASLSVSAPIESAVPDATITHTVFLPIVTQVDLSVPYVVTRIPLPPGSRPHGIALDVDNGRAFVGNYAANTLSVIDTKAMILSVTIPLPGANGPNGVAYNADLDRVYVANRNTNNLSLIDPTRGTWLKNVAVGKLPDGVAVMDGLIYAANFGSDSVSVINAQTTQVTATLAVYNQPALTALNEAAHIVYVSVYSGGSYVAAFHAGQAVPGEGSGPLPYGIAFDPITDRMYAANRGAAHTVSIMDTVTDWSAGQIDTGQEPFVVGINPRTGHLFVVCGNVVKVYDRRDAALITTIAIGSGAEEGIAVDAERGLVYVTSGDTDQVTVIQDPPTGEIAFVSWPGGRDGAANIVMTDETGRHAHTVINSPGSQSIQPVWRPDGKALAYASSNPPNDWQYWEIFTTDLGGLNPRQLTYNWGIDDRDPAWSPDGSKIVRRCGSVLCVIEANGTNDLGVISTDAGNTGGAPQWSPDGQWVAYVGATTAEGNGIYIVPAGGGTLIKVSGTPTATLDMSLSWSPDSSKIVFETDRDSILSGTQTIDNWEIYRVDIHTLVLTRLTNNTSQDRAPMWSPDGQWIAYASTGDSAPPFDYELTIMKPDGTDLRRVTTGLSVAGLFSWSPDGRRIALQSGLLEEAEIYLVEVSTGASTRMTYNTIEDSNPVWRPDTWR